MGVPKSNLQYDAGTATSAAVDVAEIGAPDAGQPKLSDETRAVAAKLSTQAISPAVLTSLVRLVEGVGLACIGLAVHLWYVAPESPFGWRYAIPLVAGAMLAVMLIQAADGYTVPAFRTHLSQLGRIFASWTLVFALFAVIAFLAKIGDHYSRVWFASWYLGGLGFFAIFRLGLAAAVRHWSRAGRLERRAVIVGGGKSAEELILALGKHADSDIRICGVFDDRGDDRSPPVVAGYPKLGTVAELVEFGRLARIDMLIVSLPLTAETRLLQVLKQLWVLPVDIRLSAHSNKLRFRPRSYSYIGAVPFLDVFDKPIADWDYVTKRLFDLVFGSIALIVASPIILAAMVAIRLESPGPVLFRQKRHGFNNEVFEVLKLRTMYHHLADPAAREVVTRNDPRVTRVGRFLRRTSIDELPQLVNVLRGELSLVGPRPHAVKARTADQLWEQIVDGYFARHRVKPGVTGWAQINGLRGEVDSPEKIRQRVEYDLYYIENWSVLFDLYILAMTPFALLKPEGAY